ncbi:MAG: peptidylprolyl isomerase [Cyanobacteria bacterium P01_H01_bin.162]
MVRLTGSVINPEKVVEHLKHEVKIKSVQQQILEQLVVIQASEARGIDVSSEEIQAEADQFRYQNRLENASQTYNWLDDQLITAEDWEQGIHARLLSQKLSQHLFDSQVAAHFLQNKVQYEQAILYRLVVPYRPLAQELFYQIEEEEISFFEAAHLYDVDENRRLTCGFEGKLSRWQVDADLSAKIFGAKPRDVVGVLQAQEGYELWMIEDFIAPELTPEIQQQILDSLFSEWLESELNYLIHCGQIEDDPHSVNL